jgi:hypothetical protein
MMLAANARGKQSMRSWPRPSSKQWSVVAQSMAMPARAATSPLPGIHIFIMILPMTPEVALARPTCRTEMPEAAPYQAGLSKLKNKIQLLYACVLCATEVAGSKGLAEEGNCICP